MESVRLELKIENKIVAKYNNTSTPRNFAGTKVVSECGEYTTPKGAGLGDQYQEPKEGKRKGGSVATNVCFFACSGFKCSAYCR